MADYPPEVYATAVNAVMAERGLASGQSRKRAERIVRTALDAVAEPLGEHVAARILAHMEANVPDPHRVGMPQAARLRAQVRRIHFQAAAQVAGLAFLTGDDVKRLAAGALARGEFIACPSLEGEDG